MPSQLPSPPTVPPRRVPPPAVEAPPTPPPRRRRRVWPWVWPLLALAVLAAIALAVSGEKTQRVPAAGPGVIANAGQFPYFHYYWVGKTFEGVPLTNADGRNGYQRAIGATTYYGNCEKGSGVLGTGG